MSTAVVPFDPSKLAVTLKRVSREAAPNAAFLKMEKSGDWVHGIGQDPVPEATEMLVNPGGFQHGYICWGEGEKLGENVVAVTDVLPDPGPVPPGAQRG